MEYFDAEAAYAWSEAEMNREWDEGTRSKEFWLNKAESALVISLLRDNGHAQLADQMQGDSERKIHMRRF